MTQTSLMWQQLPSDLDPERLPQHVAVIMDGNGRWAKQKNLPRIMGHQRGTDTLKDLLNCCRDWGIKNLTVYAFSTENWGRPQGEVDFLMALFERILKKETPEMLRKGVRIRFIGDLSVLSPSLQKVIDQSVSLTAHNQDVQFTVAVNYGGRQELVQAFQAIAQEIQRGHLNVNDLEIDENLIASHLYTKELPEPDLLIRTSGELRVSNFLLWQIAYSEMYVTHTLWPDFTRQEFHKALQAYQERDRRFGKLK